MNNSLVRHLAVAGKIWFFAVAANTLLGTIYLTDFLTQQNLIGDCLLIGTMFGAMYSFPVFLAVFILIRSCTAKHMSGEWIFRIVFICSIVLTIAVFMIFNSVNGGLGTTLYGLLFISILSAVIGVATQNKALFVLGNYSYQSNKVQL